MYQLAILDLDGTLLDTVDDLANAVNYGLAQLQYPTHPISAFPGFIGNGVRKLCERALPSETDSKEVDRLLELFQAHYTAHCMDCTRPYAGIPEVLSRLRDAGMKLAVASNKPQDFTKMLVSYFFADQKFVQILGGNETRPKKPSPEILLEILDSCDVLPEKAVMIGDSNVDILTAQNAGIDAIGCTWGFRSRAELQQAGAVYLADQPADLWEILQER